MRVTSQSFPADLRTQLQTLSEQQVVLQKQAATGQRIHTISDDPRAIRQTLELQSEARLVEQYKSNITKVREYVDISYANISSLKKLSDRAGELATQVDGSKGNEAVKAYSMEVNQLIEESVRLANTKHRSGYLFAGTNNTSAPFTPTRDGNGKITSVAYNGNAKTITVDIAETSNVPVNFAGEGANGILKNTDNGADFIRHLIDLRDKIDARDFTYIKGTSLSNLRKDEENFVNNFSLVGSIQSRMETASAIMERRLMALTPLISNESDADLTDTLVRLNELQNVYTAALQTGSTLLRSSLLDYLR